MTSHDASTGNLGIFQASNIGERYIKKLFRSSSIILATLIFGESSLLILYKNKMTTDRCCIKERHWSAQNARQQPVVQHTSRTNPTISEKEGPKQGEHLDKETKRGISAQRERPRSTIQFLKNKSRIILSRVAFVAFD